MKNFLRARGAFTLSELLMSVLVLSVIMVSLAPVVTKRVNDNISINNFKTEGVLFLVDETDPTRCNITSDVEGADPETCSFQIPDDVSQINAIVVGNGGDGANATMDALKHVTKEIATSQNITFSPTMIDPDDNTEKLVMNLKIDYMVSGGAGGGAGWGEIHSDESFREPKSQKDCNIIVGDISEGAEDIPYSAARTKFIPAHMNGIGGGNICVAKYNAGDNNGPQIPNTVTRTGTGSESTSCTGDLCCWGGETYDGSNGGNKNTSLECSNNSTTWGAYTTNYSSCNRTVCTYKAAMDICSKWSPGITNLGNWRIPNNSEILGWKKIVDTEERTSNSPEIGITRYLGNAGIQLCDNSQPVGSLKCAVYTDGCKGSEKERCDAGNVWAGRVSTRSYFTELYYGFLMTPYYSKPRDAISVRCVYGLKSNEVNSGAGGGSGASYFNHVIKNGVLEQNLTLKITIGAGGRGGISSTQTAKDGGNTTVEYGTKSVTAYGSPETGNVIGGHGSSYYIGSASTNYANRYYDGSSIKNGSTNSSKRGTHGDMSGLSTTVTAQGGAGGHSDYQWGLNGATGTQTWSGGGSGGSLSNPNGQVGQYPGAGGGGGTATVDESGNLTIGKGGNGANGAVILSYDLVPIPTVGTGGAGGGLVVGRSISVSSGDIVEASFNPTIVNIGSDFTVVAASGAPASSTTAGVANESAGSVTGDRGGTFQYQKGENGQAGGNIVDTIYMYGGTGGASGTGSQGACGGLNTYIYADSTVFTNSNDCLLNVPTGINADGSFGNFNVVEKNIIANSFGSAGSGGGGGGFSTDVLGNPIQGQGGKGANGYVYIWWVKNE